MKKEYWALLVFALIIVLQWIGLGFHGEIKTDEAGTLDFSGVPAFFVTTVLIVQCSAAQNVHRPEPYLISSTVAFSSSKVL